MDPNQQQLLLSYGGKKSTYIEDLFSTYLYKGTGSARSINNGIDISGEGGMVWTKARTVAYNHLLVDTERGSTKVLSPDLSQAEFTSSQCFTSFNSDGFSLSTDASVNSGSHDYASWSFRRASKFFDVVTWTGDDDTGTGGSARAIAHGLESVPGMIIVKCSNEDGINWAIYHRKLDASNPQNYTLYLNTTANRADSSVFGDQAPTSTHFYVSRSGGELTNSNNKTYVAYVYAHNEESFGAAGDQSIIKCDSYDSTGAAGLEVTVGWEPQWLLVKDITRTGDWMTFDPMRGMTTDGNQEILYANTNSSGNSQPSYVNLTPTGFKLMRDNTINEGDDGTFIYIAIRAAAGTVTRPPSIGSDVFAMDTGNSSTTIPALDSGFPVDFALGKFPASTDSWAATARLTGINYLVTDTSASQGTNQPKFVHDSNVGIWKDYDSTLQSWMWKRSAGFDVVCDVGTNSGKDINHSLNAVPEMIWRKNRDNSTTAQGKWIVYHKDFPASGSNLGYAFLNLSNAAGTYGQYWTQTPTSTVFSVGNDNDINYPDQNHINFLFASVSGISKVGSYDGSDSDQTITLGFEPRFLIVKAYTHAYSWLTVDTTRGWATSSGNNSKYLFLELNWAQNDIDIGYKTSTGFVAKGGSANITDAGVSYIYYAHA